MKKQTVKRQWDLLTKDVREKRTREIIYHFKSERGEDLGLLAAEDFLGFFLQLVGKNLYNKGVMDSQAVLKQRFEGLDVDLDLLIYKEEPPQYHQ